MIGEEVLCGCLLAVALVAGCGDSARQADVPSESPAATNAAPVVGKDKVAEAIGAFISSPGFMDTV